VRAHRFFVLSPVSLGFPQPNEREWGAGTTALIVLRRGGVLHVANLGDSRVVLSRGGVAKQLSQDHTPELDKDRIESAGGWITTDKELPFRKLQDMDLEDPIVQGLAKETVKWNIVTRVNGELAVARSLGDADYKLGARMSSYEWCYPDRIPRTFTSDVVSNVPDTYEFDVHPDDEFMVLACDGLWEVLSSQNVVDLTNKFLKDGSTPEVTPPWLCVCVPSTA
jgi:serine/threonine protein phosphatase PrpC